MIKTIENARVPAPEPAPQPQQMDAQTTSWVEWVDGRIEQMRDFILDTVGQALGELLDKQHESLQAALDRRDHAIQALRDEVEIKIGLGRKLARLKAEAAEARQQARERELEGLQRELGTFKSRSRKKRSDVCAASRASWHMRRSSWMPSNRKIASRCR